MGFVAATERRRWAVYADFVSTRDAVAAVAKRHGYSASTVRVHIKRCKAILDGIGMRLVRKETGDA